MGAASFSLYIVRCTDGTLYTGIATDVARRIQEHESGVRGAKYLRGKGPLRLEFECLLGDRSVASKVENRVKRLDRQHKEELIAGRFRIADLLPTAGAAAAQASGDA